MSHKNDDSLTAIGGMIATFVLLWWAGKLALKILGGIAYFFASLIPIVFFYAVPFIFLSILVGLLLAFVSKPNQDRELDYRALVIAFPVLCALTLFTVGPPKQRIVHFMDKGKEVKTQTVEEVPVIYNAFKTFQRSFGLEGKYDWEFIEYDLKDVAYVVWLSIILGGPGIFFWQFAAKQKREEDERLRRLLVVPLEETIKEKTQRINDEIHDRLYLQRELKERDQEIERLKAREEFLTKKEQTPAEPANQSKPKGVMDGDDL